MNQLYNWNFIQFFCILIVIYFGNGFHVFRCQRVLVLIHSTNFSTRVLMRLKVGKFLIASWKTQSKFKSTQPSLCLLIGLSLVEETQANPLHGFKQVSYSVCRNIPKMYVIYMNMTIVNVTCFHDSNFSWYLHNFVWYF